MGNPKKNIKKRPQILDRPYGKHAKLEDEIKHLQNGYEKIDTSTIKTFAQFPLSEKTQEALRRGKYTTPTSIQLQTIGLALQGKDVLGAAKTGSGKTLAFLIPLIECLYRQRWQHIDGVGALVISPTRELAYQTFEVLKKIGKIHDFSAGLAIGGKFMREESACINKTNIVICTPGRLLHHMDQTVNFNLDYLQMLDEADRILDLGFKKTMTGIIENLPRTRQTLLFSATQTKSVKELARLSLKSPVYVSIHEKDSHSTPTNLRQKYMVCDLEEKINIVWSFLQTHHNYKTLIFLNSCKQVRYVHESFKNLKAGLTVLALHGSMKQLKRVDIYEQFCNKQHVALIATDIASRGLDFPGVQWVIQMDCPEDTTIYIHRVGRTARYKENGEALLLLTPSEEPAMVKALKHKKIPIDEIKINHSKLRSIQGKLEAQCAADPQMKEFAQRAFMSYIKSIYMMKNKEIFNIHNYDLDKYSSSLGLANPPRIRFLQKAERRAAQQKSVNDVDDTRLSDTEANFNDDDASDDGEFLTVKRRDVQIPEEEMAELDDDLEKLEEKKNSQKKGMTQAQYAKKLMKKKILVNKKTTFDDEGGIVHDPYKPRTDDIEEADAQGLNLSDARSRMIEEDQTDKQLYRDLIKKRKREKKIKKKEDKKKWLDRQKAQEKEEEPEVVLGTPDSDADGSGGESPDDTEEYQGPRGSFQQFDHDVDDEEMEEQRVRKKRKLMKASEKGNPSVLRDAEDLAMMLLS